MIDKGLSAGKSFDWFSPLAYVLGTLAHGGGYTFTMPACELVPREIEWLLRDQGITTWGAMIADNTFALTVKKQDAARAYGILERAGVPVENPPPMEARQSRPKRKERAGSPFKVFDIFDR